MPSVFPELLPRAEMARNGGHGVNSLRSRFPSGSRARKSHERFGSWGFRVRSNEWCNFICRSFRA
jgi:hypothetical protein